MRGDRHEDGRRRMIDRMMIRVVRPASGRSPQEERQAEARAVAMVNRAVAHVTAAA